MTTLGAVGIPEERGEYNNFGLGSRGNRYDMCVEMTDGDVFTRAKSSPYSQQGTLSQVHSGSQRDKRRICLCALALI